MNNRASYSVVLHKKHGVVAVKDEFRPARPTRTVTNDAENVIADLVERGWLEPGERVIYRDTDGRWDELLVKEGKFAGFSSIGASTAREAIAKIKVPS